MDELRHWHIGIVGNESGMRTDSMHGSLFLAENEYFYSNYRYWELTYLNFLMCCGSTSVGKNDAV